MSSNGVHEYISVYMSSNGVHEYVPVYTSAYRCT